MHSKAEGSHIACLADESGRTELTFTFIYTLQGIVSDLGRCLSQIRLLAARGMLRNLRAGRRLMTHRACQPCRPSGPPCGIAAQPQQRQELLKACGESSRRSSA